MRQMFLFLNGKCIATSHGTTCKQYVQEVTAAGGCVVRTAIGDVEFKLQPGDKLTASFKRA